MLGDKRKNYFTYCATLYLVVCELIQSLCRTTKALLIIIMHDASIIVISVFPFPYTRKHYLLRIISK